MIRKLRRPLGRPSDPDAAHRRAAEQLRSAITSRRWKVGDAIPSLRQLAREMRFSIGAVRQALEQLKRERRIHVNARRRMVITRIVDSPMDGRDYLLVVSSNPLQTVDFDSDHMDLMQGCVKGAGELGIPLLAAHAHGFESALPSGFLGLPLKGILLIGHFTNACLKQYEALSVPVILLDHPPHGRKLGSVSVDNRAAARDATRRLLEAGHKRIAFVRRVIYHVEDVDPDSKERLAGFLEALKEARIKRASDCIFNMLPERGAPTYSLKKIFTNHQPFTAVVCADDYIATLVASEALKNNRQVPADFGVVGFQSFRSTTRFSGPASDFREMGAAACRLLAHFSSSTRELRMPCIWREKQSFVSLR